MQENSRKYFTENPMGERAIFPLLMSMAFPPILSMLIQSLYNIVDSIYVARLGENAITAVSLAFPLQNLILAVAVGLGVGANACIARNLGSGRRRTAEQAAAHSLVLTVFHVIFFILLGMFGTMPYLHIFTQDSEVLAMSCDYTYIVVCFSAGTLFHIAIEKIFQAVGSMVIPMCLQGLGALINIVLDPIMIFGKFGFPAMGVKGAAIATVIGQWTACLISVILLICSKKKIHVSLRRFRFQKTLVKTIYGVAVPSAIMTALPSVLVSILNGILSRISQTAIAVLGLYFKMQTFVYMPASGLIQGMRPIISYNYGAGSPARVKKTIRASLLSTAVIMAVGTILFLACPAQIMALFDAEPALMEMGVLALRIIGLGFLWSAVGVVCSGTFEALGKGTPSLVISLLRQLLIIPPLSLLLIPFWDVAGVWVTFPVAEAAAAIVSVLLLLRFFRREKQRQRT